MEDKNNPLIELGREVLFQESQALLAASERLGRTFESAVTAILKCTGKVIATGLGKSGHIAEKIASTLSSTGTPAFFIHPSEAMHGDFGMMDANDCLLAVAFGGETREVLASLRYAKGLNIPTIAITGFLDSSLGRMADIALDGSIDREADSLNLAPTCSSAVALALGDALAVVLMHMRGFTKESFAQLHPGGRIGRNLTKISELMHPANKLAVLLEESDFHAVLEAVTTPNFGIAAVMGQKNGEVQNGSILLGSITDGDLRRALLQLGGQALHSTAGSLMTRSPKTIGPDVLAIDAISIMEQYKITSLFVTCPKDHSLLGLVRLHDLLSAKII